MKKIFSICVIILSCVICANATIRTVNNSPGGAGQHISLQEAIDASAPYDTLYVHASAIMYPTVTIVRPLVIFGEGALPDQQYQFKTQIQRVNLYYSADFLSNAGGSKIYGCRIDELFIGTGDVNGVSDITLERNQINMLRLAQGGPPIYALGIHNNIVVTNNLIGNLYGLIMSNCVFLNNVMRDTSIQLGGSYNNLIANNVFVGNSQGFGGAQIMNNLFMKYQGDTQDNNIFGSNCSYVNNVFSNGAYFCSQCGISQINNVFNAGVIVVQSPSGQGILWDSDYGNYNGTLFPNFHLLAGSAGVGFGTDNTDVGIYGGAFPWVDYNSLDERFRYFAPPSQLPVLQEFNIQNPAINPNDQIIIQIKAKSQN